MPMDKSQPSVVIAIECIAGSSNAIEFNADKLQTGDVVDEFQIGSCPAVRSPFKGGKSGVNKILHAAFKRGNTSIRVRVRRGADSQTIELNACVVPDEKMEGRKQYVLRSIRDPNYSVGFVEKMESECLALQGSRSTRVVSALSKAQIQDGYIAYPWEMKMKEALPLPNSSSFLSMLVLPRVSDPVAYRYNSLEDTLARANSWLNSSQASGVPIQFMNVQTEGLLTKISGEMASSTVHTGPLSDLSSLANASLYGFEDYHGVDIGVMRAIRLWYTPTAGELAVQIKLQEGDSKLGFSISRTEEGFIYISSVSDEDDPGTNSTRSDLLNLYKEAKKASKLLVISRVSNEKILPWMVSSSGALRCFDIVSLSHKLSLHRHALRPVLLHVLIWEHPSTFKQIINVPPPELSREFSLSPLTCQNLSLGDSSVPSYDAGDVSFRVDDFSFS